MGLPREKRDQLVREERDWCLLWALKAVVAEKGEQWYQHRTGLFKPNIGEPHSARVARELRRSALERNHALLGGGLEAYFDPKKRQAIRIDQPKKIKNYEKVKLPPYL